MIQGKKYINKKNKLIFAVSLIIVLIILLIIIIIFAKNKTIQRENDEKITEYLKNKYNITDIKYIKRDNLLEKYNTTAGDAGSGRRKLKKYIYYYKFNYNNINNYAYIIDGICSDDYIYENQLEYARDEFKKFTQKDVTITQDYLDPEEILHYKNYEDTRFRRIAVISIEDFSYNIINKAFVDKYVNIYEKISSSLNNVNFKLYLQFKEDIVLLNKSNVLKENWNSDYEILFKDNKYNNNSKLIEELDRYSFNEEFSILSNSSDEAISWCIKNRKGWHDYYEHKKIEN